LDRFQKLALWLLRDARDSAHLLDSFDVWTPVMLKLGRTRSGRHSLEVLFTYMFQVIDPMKQEELRAKIRTLASRSEEVATTIAEYLRREGRKEGRKRGIKEGLKKGRQKGRQEVASTHCAACSPSSSRPLAQNTRPACKQRSRRRSTAISDAC
jgi:predicted transposase YdaD